ncbi:ABC transporter ATP-binding protein [Georgenia sp. Z1344]|uniref:ABC transporter ATP-binding protein n=1 Tax=Georgenia sp. Z1344 TaxID=3416706 RepID=UPI003CF15599
MPDTATDHSPATDEAASTEGAPTGTTPTTGTSSREGAAGTPGSGTLSVTGLRKDFGPTAAVDGISFEVPAGSFLVLLGPSGCGKTTTLRMLAGLEDPTGGEIAFGGRVVARGDGTVDVPASRRGAGLVFQSYALWPHRTVRGNVDWPLKVAKWGADRRRARVAEVLALLGITELADRYPGEISGGQQQRVAIARMIAPEPEILLFDEPLSNLDARLRVDTRSELMRIHRATGATSVYVTHDQVEAMTMATHVVLMKDGRIEQFGTPLELLRTPRTAFTSTFIGTPPANVVACSVSAGRIVHGASGIDLGPAPAGPADGERVHAMYRATSVALETPEPDDDAHARSLSLSGVLADQAPLADRWVVGVDVPGAGRMSVVRAAPAPMLPGDDVRLVLPDSPDAVFSPDGVVVGAPATTGNA